VLAEREEKGGVVVYSLRRRVLKRLRLVSLLGVCQWLVDLLVVVFNPDFGKIQIVVVREWG
jgi:hypothetical protein